MLLRSYFSSTYILFVCTGKQEEMRGQHMKYCIQCTDALAVAWEWTEQESRDTEDSQWKGITFTLVNPSRARSVKTINSKLGDIVNHEESGDGEIKMEKSSQWATWIRGLDE